MNVLEFCNYVLSLCGEQPLLSTTGNLGSLLRNAIQTALLKVTQETRATFFEQMITMTATDDSYLVPAGTLPDEVAQVFNVWLVASDCVYPLARSAFEKLNYMSPLYSYDIIGSDLYLNASIVRPAELRLKVLAVPTLPIADDAEVNFPLALHAAIAHTAASIILVSYVDDSSAAAIQQRMAEMLIVNIRNHFGVGRARTFSMNNTNTGRGYTW